jgi:hypothetical protein
VAQLFIQAVQQASVLDYRSGVFIHRRQPRRSCRLIQTYKLLALKLAFPNDYDTYAIAKDAGTPMRGMLTRDRSMPVLAKRFIPDCGRLTETEETTEKNSHNQQCDSYEELASFSDRWHKGITHGILPNLY